MKSVGVEALARDGGGDRVVGKQHKDVEAVSRDGGRDRHCVVGTQQADVEALARGRSVADSRSGI